MFSLALINYSNIQTKNTPCLKLPKPTHVLSFSQSCFLEPNQVLILKTGLIYADFRVWISRKNRSLWGRKKWFKRCSMRKGGAMGLLFGGERGKNIV
jgi:hypothetical protein